MNVIGWAFGQCPTFGAPSSRHAKRLRLSYRNMAGYTKICCWQPQTGTRFDCMSVICRCPKLSSPPVSAILGIFPESPMMYLARSSLHRSTTKPGWSCKIPHYFYSSLSESDRSVIGGVCCTAVLPFVLFWVALLGALGRSEIRLLFDSTDKQSLVFICVLLCVCVCVCVSSH